MKKKCLLINIGRGSAVNEDDLINHLNKNPTFYASLDVFNKEPLDKKHLFWHHSNVTITPHVAAVTDINSSIDYIYSRFKEFKKNKKIRSDIKYKNGY